jgi:Uma2 family endonuclease
MSTARARKTRPPKLGRSSNGMLMTPEEFDAITEYDENFNYELVRGIVIVNPKPAPTERSPNDFLAHLLLDYATNHPFGSFLDETLPEHYIEVPDGRRCADRVVWTGLGRPPVSRDLPTIAIEFVSRRKRDRVRDYVEKRREYLELGILEYWIIDRFQRIMTVYRKPPAEPAEQVFKADGIYRTPLLPGFELPLAALLARSDRWEGERRRK